MADTAPPAPSARYAARCTTCRRTPPLPPPRSPQGADWHRKYHLLRADLATGVDPASLTRDTQIGGVKIGSWLHRQLTTWHSLADGQQQLMAALGLTPEANPLAPARRARRTARRKAAGQRGPGAGGARSWRRPAGILSAVQPLILTEALLFQV
ncbi:hypothetical protein ACH4PW_36775 [Streptomyces sp. NPDC017082]|uniref:hypothetical protein n=1 Tax=Streptomyces sp. NPDC017082 TaxID=3364974 RepID=UPI0037BD1B4D